MTQSPGHQKWPEHKVEENHLQKNMQIDVDGEIIADSADVILVNEDRHRERYYFPRADIQMNRLEASDTTTTCPFKGKASYFNLNLGGRVLKDAAWSYEEPYDEHQSLKDRIAFYNEMPELRTTGAD